MRRLILLSCILLPALGSAAEPAKKAAEEKTARPEGLEAVPEVPEPPLPVQSGEQMEPDITIIRRGDKMIHEYRHNGTLYMVKIVPDKGPPYYLYDSDGDGTLDASRGSNDIRRSDVETGMRINQWKIFSWK